MKRICFILLGVLFTFLAVSSVALAAEDNPPYYGAISGQVRVASTTDAVYGQSGALVAAWRAEGPAVVPVEDGAGLAPAFPRGQAGQFVRWTTTDHSGNYLLADLPPGTYFLAAAAPETLAAWFKPAPGGMVQVTAGQVADKDFTLEGPDGALGGRVTNAEGNGVAQATIVVLPSPGSATTTSLDGGVTITAEAQGEVAIQQNGLSIRLKAAGEGEGQATLTQEQAGLLARIAYYQTRTDAGGYYFMPGVKPGDYWVLAFKNGVYDLQETRVEARQLTPVDFRLPVPAIVIQPQPPERPTPHPTQGPPGPPDKIKIFIRGRLFNTEAPPIMENNRVLLPLRELAEALGAEVIWEGQGQGMVTIKKGEVTVRLQIQDKVAHQNGKAVQMDAPARVQKGRTMVPARFLSQALGARVRWDAASNSVWIE